MSNILEKLELYNNLISESKPDEFVKGDRVEVIDGGKRGEVVKVLEYDRILRDYQYEVKIGNRTKTYVGSELKRL